MPIMARRSQVLASKQNYLSIFHSPLIMTYTVKTDGMHCELTSAVFWEEDFLIKVDEGLEIGSNGGQKILQTAILTQNRIIDL